MFPNTLIEENEEFNTSLLLFQVQNSSSNDDENDFEAHIFFIKMDLNFQVLILTKIILI
jgi:hypothetical protein